VVKDLDESLDGGLDGRSMATHQGALPPQWRGRSRWWLLKAVAGGWAQNRDKIVQLLSFFGALMRPRVVRQRLERLHRLGHIDEQPRVAQMLIAARDQMLLAAADETRLFYESQGIPWFFHNLRRFISGPATVIDPVGLFSHRDAIIHHVLQTFHRHPLYDLVLLRAHGRPNEAADSGPAHMLRQVEQLCAGIHPHQRALTSLIEDGGYHERLLRDVQAFVADPQMPARPLPAGLVPDAALMLGMDQFKDVRGFMRYAKRVRGRFSDVVLAWCQVLWNETVGRVLSARWGPGAVDISACDADLVRKHQLSSK